MNSILDLDDLTKALENEENADLIDLDNSKIKCRKKE